MNAIINLSINATGNRAERVLRRVDANVNQLTRSMNRATVASQRMNTAMRLKRFDQFGKNIQWVGRQIEFNFTLPLMVAAGFATAWALDNEKAMTQVRKVYNESTSDALDFNEELTALGESFRLLSDLMGIHQDEVINIGAEWARTGANGRALAEITQLTMQAMIIGEMEAAEATEALIAVQQQFQVQVTDMGKDILDLTEILAYMNAIENETAVSLEDLVVGFQRAAGIAREAGVGPRELAASMASLVPAAANAQVAGRMLRTTISRIMAPTTQAKNVMAELGINTEDTSWTTKNFTDRLKTLSGVYEDLTEDEKARVATILAGRRQVSRFTVLMRDLADEQGRYATAMRVTRTEQEALNRMQQELQIFLTSTPQGFQILIAQIRNLMTEAVQPLLPVMMKFLATIRDIMRGFLDLSEAQQMGIFYLGVFMVLVGPFMRILGATIMLLASFAGGFYFIGRGILFVLTPLRLLGTGLIALGAIFKITFLKQVATALAAGLARIIAFSGTALTVFGGFFKAVLFGFTRFFGLLIGVMGRGLAAMLTMTLTVGKFTRGFMAFAWGSIAIVSNMFTNLGRIFAAGFTGLIAMTQAAIPLLLSPWTVLVVALLGVLWAFWDEIAEFIGSLIDVWYQLPEGVTNALVAMVSVIREAALAVYEWLQWMNPFARHSPSLVESVRAGVNIIAQEYARLSTVGTVFSRAINDLRSFTRATEDARRRFREADFAEMRAEVLAAEPGAGNEFDAVVNGIYELEEALQRIQIEYDKQVRVVNRWEAALEQVNFELDAQQMILEELEAHAASLGNELSAAESRLADLMETPIAGMGAMSNAIFENEMAQKQLRLELLRLEETYGVIDGIRERMAELSGDIDMLNAKREDLRLAGAGSDVLGAIDAQLAQLEAERRALGDLESGPISDMENLRNQLEELQRQGEILNLEESLTFDPLVRQLEEATTKIKELPFDELLAKILAEQANIDNLSQQYDKATEAAEAQRLVVDELIAQRDAVEDRYDMELEKLEQLGDAYSAIEQQINDMEEALSQFAQAASSGGGGGGAGADSLLGPGGDFPIPGGAGADLTGGDIESFNEMIREQVEELYQFDIWTLLREQWDSFLAYLREQWDNFKQWLLDQGIDLDQITAGASEAWDNLVENVRERAQELLGYIDFEDVQSRLEEFAQMAEPIITAVQEAWQLLVDFFRDLWEEITENFDVSAEDIGIIMETIATVIAVNIGIIVGVFTVVWPIIRNTVQSFFTWFADVMGAIIRALSGVIEFLAGVFTGDWEKMWNGIKNIAGGIWDGINATFQLALDVMGGIVEGALEGVIDLWNWLKDTVVGEILLDFRDGILEKWRTMKADAAEEWNSILSKISEIWNGIKNWVTTKVTEIRNTVGTRWAEIRDRISARLNDIKAKISQLGGWLNDYVTNPVQSVKNTLARLWNSIKTKVVDVWNSIAGVLNSAAEGIERMFYKLVEAWNSLPFNGPDIKVEFDIPDIPTFSTGGGGSSTRHAGSGTGGISYFHAGAVLREPTLGLMAEYAGAASNPEIVTPENLMRQIFTESLAKFATVQSSDGGDTSIIQINGNLEFPNISDGGDAEEFVRNLEAMAT